MKKNNLVVYTVLTGNKSRLNNPFLEEYRDLERICFTDDMSIEANGWKLVKLEDKFLDPNRSSRHPKLLPHLYFPNFEWSIYLDNTVKLKMAPTDILEFHTDKKKNFWCFQHPWRDCIYDEAEEVIQLGFDSESRVREQMDHYRREGHPAKAGLTTNSFLVRRHNDEDIIRVCETWYEHVLRFSKRDQLSFNFVAHKMNFEYAILKDEITKNDLISWPGYKKQFRLPGNFDEEKYAWLNPEVFQSGLSPQKHYISIGAEKKLPFSKKTGELDRLANKYKTDKGSLYYNAHAYSGIYEYYFKDIKDQSLRILEIGLLRHDVQAQNPNGPYNDAPSLFMWREYFPNSELIGFDIADFSDLPDIPNCKIVRGDMGNPKDLLSLVANKGDRFDIVIDDASHASHHQQIALGTLFPYLKEGGVYFIEDLNYQPIQLEKPQVRKTKELLMSLKLGGMAKSEFLSDKQLLYLANNIEFIEFYDSMDRNFGGLQQDAIVVIKKTSKMNKAHSIKVPLIDMREQQNYFMSSAAELAEIKNSKAWKLALFFRQIRVLIAPPNSKRSRLLSTLKGGFQEIIRNGFISFMKKAIMKIRSYIWIFCKKNDGIRKISRDSYIKIDAVSTPAIIKKRSVPIDIIVCIHNALDDVKICLESILKYTNLPFQLIIIDDGSSNPTEEYLKKFSNDREDIRLLRNEVATGYTIAANIGLRSSHAEYVVLINSDTIVGPEWLDRLYSTISSSDKLGVVGPLSNTASWQSVPEIEENKDWASNPLPDGISFEQMSQNIAKYSGMLRPEAKLLNGFCLMIRRDLIKQIGYFDEENFGTGYGEEDDFILRSRKAGWKLAISDDVYIYHSQSKSYTNERRLTLSKQAGQKLQKKHGAGIISESIRFMNPNRIMEGIRARSVVAPKRAQIIAKGEKEFANKKVMFILPIMDAGGGGNVVIDEARAMQKMGVNVTIFNLSKYKNGFLTNYPNLDIPTIFGVRESLASYANHYDAVIATANYSVEWLKPVREKFNNMKLGYYVQGFEPLIYDSGTKDFEKALASYNLIENMILFTKTEWVLNTVFNNTRKKSTNIGISVNIDLFRPRHSRTFHHKPVVITAMVRPGSPYRSPKMTMEILQKIDLHFGFDVDIRLFGSDDIRDPNLSISTDFKWTQAGKLTQNQVATFLSDSDIFVDFSEHQAMGLTALEAMACGCAVIVPQEGGAIEFVRDRKNGLVVNTNNFDDCFDSLALLVKNDELRKNLQVSATHDVAGYYPEDASYNILNLLFGKEHR